MVSLLLLAALTEQSAFVHSPTAEYKKLQLAGFTVLVSPAVMADARSAEQALGLLETKLREVKRVVPAQALEKIARTQVWVERDNPDVMGAVYHPSAEWLKDHGYNPDKEKGVEIGNIRNFVDWATRTQPMMVLHELAHAYHHQVVGYADKRVRAAFDAATKSGAYDKVLFVSGGEKKAYAMTNVMEYFAESSEAYFGVNDFFPFNRWQLLSTDRPMYEALVAAWGLPRGEAMAVGSSATPEVLRSIGRTRGL
jgi:hypothetical protein